MKRAFAVTVLFVIVFVMIQLSDSTLGDRREVGPSPAVLVPVVVGQPDGPNEARAAVRVQVNDVAGNPIASASVSAFDPVRPSARPTWKGATEQDGSVVAQILLPCWIAAGSPMHPARVVWVSDASSQVIVLERANTFSVRVLSDSGAAVPGASVRLFPGPVSLGWRAASRDCCAKLDLASKSGPDGVAHFPVERVALDWWVWAEAGTLIGQSAARDLGTPATLQLRSTKMVPVSVIDKSTGVPLASSLTLTSVDGTEIRSIMPGATGQYLVPTTPQGQWCVVESPAYERVRVRIEYQKRTYVVKMIRAKTLVVEVTRQGRIASGAKVRLSPLRLHPPSESFSTTGVDGRVELPLRNRRAVHWVTAELNGEFGARRIPARDLDAVASVALRKSVSLVARVEANGRPVRGARVSAVVTEVDGEDWNTWPQNFLNGPNRSDSTGTVRFSQVPVGARITVVASKHGVGAAVMDAVAEAKGRAIVMNLQPPMACEIEVVDAADSSPVGSAQAKLYRAQRRYPRLLVAALNQELRSGVDENGVVNIPAVFGQAWDIELVAPGFIRRVASIGPDDRRVRVSLRRFASVSGTVHGLAALPEESRWVVASPISSDSGLLPGELADPQIQLRAKCDEKGDFVVRFLTPAKQYSIGIADLGPFASRRIEIRAPASDIGVRVAKRKWCSLVVRAPSVVGRILTLTTKAKAGGKLTQHRFVPPSGTVRYVIPQGTLWALFDSVDGFPVAMPLTVDTNSLSMDVSITFARFEVSVVDRSSRPVRRAVVHVRREPASRNPIDGRSAWRGEWVARTNAAGKVMVPFPVEAWSVVAGGKRESRPVFGTGAPSRPVVLVVED